MLTDGLASLQINVRVCISDPNLGSVASVDLGASLEQQSLSTAALGEGEIPALKFRPRYAVCINNDEIFQMKYHDDVIQVKTSSEMLETNKLKEDSARKSWMEANWSVQTAGS